MIVKMDNISVPSFRELAHRLYDQNIELEAKRWRSAKARVPSDPNAWQQMRENFEAIILEDHAFSEQHNIEYALWQLHYKRIEELRSHFSAALASASFMTSHGGKVPTRPDRITKIRLQLKTFLSEATGFYHDLILKIRSKCGLPLGHFSEDSENQIPLEKDGNKSTVAKQGLLSCHRCLIYLGDLARYKGLYAESDSKSRDYAAASSYYLQAASVWPSSGNPHHQLAILASYSGDELVAVYRYFRSIAVEIPFSTARENLIVAFEKNRKSYSPLLGESKISVLKESTTRTTSNDRRKEEAKAASKYKDTESSLTKERVSGMSEIYEAFCIRFVRLNGILFTRTSMETFAEVLSFVSSSLCQLLSFGPNEELNFGRDVVENRLMMVRIVSILVFNCHNVKNDTEGQSYAEILKRSVLLQTSFAAVFDFMGQVVKRCLVLRHPSSSFFLPGILIFMEWLAYCPDAASGSDMGEKEAIVRSLFWNNCVSFLNKLLEDSSVYVDDDNGSFFFNTNELGEEETGNQHALWEDFELRGFLPLLPAQSILDFSRKNFFGSVGNKEEKARVKRILAAGKALTNVVRVNKKEICFDSNVKKFIIGSEFSEEKSGILKSNGMIPECPPEKVTNSVVLPKNQLNIEVDEDDEEIVFKPALTEKCSEVDDAKWPVYEVLEPGQSVSAESTNIYSSDLSPHLLNPPHHAVFNPSSQPPLSASGIVPQHPHPIKSRPSNWLMEHVTLANDMKSLGLVGNGHVTLKNWQENTGISQAYSSSHLFIPCQPYNMDTSGISYSQTNAPEWLTTFRVNNLASSGVRTDNLPPSTLTLLPLSSHKVPVSRPVRHLGPPPGFTSAPKHANQPISASDLMIESQLIDDYSWLDGYKVAFSNAIGINSTINPASYSYSQFITSSNGIPGTINFPFPGKQNPRVQFQLEKQNHRQNYQPLEHLKHEHKLRQPQLQLQRMEGIQELNPLSEQYQGNNVWMRPPIV